MSEKQPNNPLHGVRLQDIVEALFQHYGWSGLAQRIPVNCFKNDPSVKSALKFLRRTPWAREKTEALYLATFHQANPWLQGNKQRKDTDH